MAEQGLPLEKLGHTPGKSDLPAHTPHTTKGEEWIGRIGREPGRPTKGGRTARDATSICPADRGPIIPEMPNFPPA